MSPEIIIRPWSETDSISELTDLLHRAYKIWLDQDIRFTATDQSEETTRNRMKDAFNWVAELDGKLVGSISLHGESTDQYLEYYKRPGVWYFGQIGVDPEVRGTGLGIRLIETAEKFAREHGAIELACDTAEPAIWLHGYYERLGFNLVDSHDWEFANYRSLVYTKRLT